MEAFQTVSFAQEVIFGSGSLARLPEAVDRFGWQRLMLCTNHSLRVNGHATAVESWLGDRLVAVCDRVQPHVQDKQVEEMLAVGGQKEVDAVIGLGGGSPIGMAKALAKAFADQRTGQPARQPFVPVIAIPTTYAGSEMTAVVGITYTRETPSRKITLNDPRIAPRLVIYDPQLTLDLPAEMTASTGINALAHCVEALYSITRNPLSTLAASSGARYLYHALPRCYRQGDDIEARTDMLVGSYLAGFSLASVKMGLHHGLCHVLGGTANVPHGIANSILLPYAMRFNAEATAPLLLPLVEAMGIAGNGLSPLQAVEAAARSLFDLIGQMHLPQRLRDVGVKQSDLPQLAQLGFQNQTVQNNPRPITDAAQIEALLKEAW